MENRSNWIEWDPTDNVGARNHVLSVTLMKVGRIALSFATHKKYWADKKYALLFFNPVENQIGIKPIGEPVQKSYEVASGPKNQHQIGATAFCKKFGINHEKARKFPVIWDQENEMVILQL